MPALALGKRRAVAPRSHGLRLPTTGGVVPPVDTFYRITQFVNRVTTGADQRTTSDGDDRVVQLSYRRVTTTGDPRVWQH